MKKKGLESVEVWMWLIAGLVLGGLLFGGGYAMLGRWVHNSQLKEVQDNFETLKSSIASSCTVGFGRDELKRYSFPRLVRNISIKNESNGFVGRGNMLCMHLEGESEFCEPLDRPPYACQKEIAMQTLQFDEENSLFAVIQKALGREEKIVIDFYTYRLEENACVSFDLKHVDASLGVEEPQPMDRCDSDCDCGKSMYCTDIALAYSAVGYCCEKGEYFDPADSSCKSFSGNSICETVAGETCAGELDCFCYQCCPGCKDAAPNGCCKDGMYVCGNSCKASPETLITTGDPCDCDQECASGICARGQCEEDEEPGETPDELTGLSCPAPGKTITCHYQSLGLCANTLGEGHEGVDFAGAGWNVLAAGDGVVEYASGAGNSVPGQWWGYGNAVKIRHNLNGQTIYTVYTHLSSISVSAGQTVNTGDLVGISGSTGRTFGAHLHFEVRNKGGYWGQHVNPGDYLPSGCY